MTIELNQFKVVILWQQDDVGEWWCVECYDTPAGLQIAGNVFKAYV